MRSSLHFIQLDNEYLCQMPVLGPPYCVPLGDDWNVYPCILNSFKLCKLAGEGMSGSGPLFSSWQHSLGWSFMLRRMVSTIRRHTIQRAPAPASPHSPPMAPHPGSHSPDANPNLFFSYCFASKVRTVSFQLLCQVHSEHTLNKKVQTQRTVQGQVSGTGGQRVPGRTYKVWEGRSWQ